MERSICKQCGKDFSYYKSARPNAMFCTTACKGAWQSQHLVGDKHPRWQGGDRQKTCRYCEKQFSQNATEAISIFKRRKFCSKECADKGGIRYKGEAHPNYRKEARRRNRGGSHKKWVNAVIARDKATCQKCGAKNTEIHAHHIKSFKDYPELRNDVGNGVTLCAPCHWAEHTALNENRVNSGDLLTDNAEDNPEPSSNGNILEGVTTRGRAYRRWVGKCHWCGVSISKPLSDIKGKQHVFCSKHCMGKHRAATRTWRKTNMPIPSTAVISSTSARPERDNIV